MPTIKKWTLGFFDTDRTGSQVCVMPVSGKLRTEGRMSSCWMEVQVQVEISI